MTRSLMLLALVAALAHPTPAQACACEDAWEETVTTLWQGQLLEPLHTDAISCPELRYLRNIPYARHGFSFGDNWVGKKFVGDPRYQRDEYVTSETVEPMLTPGDRTNIEMLVAAEEGMQCKAWWERNGENPAGWNFDNDFESETEVAKPSPGYAPVQDIHVGSDGITYVTLGEATPNFLIDRALDEKGIENEWLAPLTCTELDRLEDALYARHLVDFEDDADEAFFAAATVGIYKPVPNLTREGAEYFFSSQDKLTQLRVNRAQSERNCMEGK